MCLFRRNVARIPTEPVKDIEGTITSATKDGTVERPFHMSAEQVEKIHKKSHVEWIEAYKENPNVDIALVEAMLIPVSESRFIDLNLHIGKIDDYNFGTERYNIMLDSFNACMPGDNQEEALKALADRFKIEDDVVAKAKSGKLLRVWTSNNASAYCGLCYLASKLEDVDCKIVLLNLPTKVRMADGKLKRSHWLSWGMFPYGEMAFPISQSSVKILSANDITH